MGFGERMAVYSSCEIIMLAVRARGRSFGVPAASSQYRDLCCSWMCAGILYFQNTGWSFCCGFRRQRVHSTGTLVEGEAAEYLLADP